jgi:penicillin-binding protein 1C
VPAVELASRLGTGSLLQTLHLAGFASLDREAEHYGLGLALGNGDVTLLELANGYRALANGGLWRPWSWRPTAASAQRDARTERVISPVASAIVLDMLSDASARIPGFGTSTPFDFPFPAAVKTGTSRHFTDNWSVATTRNFTVAVWAGNFSGRPMQGVSGVTGAGPLLSRVVMETARRYPPGVLTTPADAGAVALPVCRLSGMRATPDCAQLTEWFARGTEPSRADDWERAGVVTLPEEYAEWSRQEVRAGSSGVTLAGGPAGTRTLAEPVVPESPTSARVTGTAGSSRATVPRFRIVSPLDGDRYSIPAGIDARYATISLRAVGGGATVRWSIDGAAYSKGRWALAVGEHVFRAVSARGDTSEARVTVVP